MVVRYSASGVAGATAAVAGHTLFLPGVVTRMFGQPAPTGLDVRFSVVGIPIRIHPGFWLTAGFLAWGPDPKYVFVRILCIFLAVMVHELGHAVVTRWFGWRPEIVLYFFGGYATTQRYSTWKDIAVSAAGPAAGFLLYAMFLIGAVALADDQVRGLATSPVLYDAVHFSLESRDVKRAYVRFRFNSQHQIRDDFSAVRTKLEPCGSVACGE